MSDKTNIKNKMSELRTTPAFEPFSKVILWYDDENCFTAGDDTGRTLEADCPWATQTMCNNILNAISGFVYRPYEAEDAIVDPAAEIGDGIGVKNFYSILASQTTNFDVMCAADISAPADEEIDHEFPFVSPIKRELDRKITLGTNYYGTRITRQNGLEIVKTDGQSEMSRVVLNSDQLAFYDDNGSEAIYFDPNTGKYTFTGTVMIGGSIDIGNGNFTVDESGNVHIPNGTISFSQLDSTTQNVIEDAADDAYNATMQVGRWTYGSTTYIDGTMLMTGTVTASEIRGGVVYLLDNRGYEAGEFSLDSSSSGYKIAISSDGGIQLSTSSNIFFSSGGAELGVNATGNIAAKGSIIPRSSNTYDLGSSSFKWSDVYATNGTIQTSDRQAKTDIVYMPEVYCELFSKLRPVSYKFVDGHRTHLGFIAQDVENALAECGLTGEDFAGFVKTHDEDGNTVYALRYTEFIAMNTMEIQKLKAENEALKARLDRLEALIDA